MKQLLALVSVAALSVSIPTSAQRAAVDAKAEIAAVAYTYAVQVAERDRIADDRIRTLQNQIERLGLEVRKGKVAEAKTLTALNAAKQEFVAVMERQSRQYADQIAEVRRAAEDVVASPEGAEALAMFNAGKQVEAIGIIDKLVDLKVATLRRSAVRFADIAHADRNLSTGDLIKRYEDLVELDGSQSPDWGRLSALYAESGRPGDALSAAQRAVEVSQSDGPRLVALQAMGKLLPGREALVPFTKALEIAQRLVADNPSEPSFLWAVSMTHLLIAGRQTSLGDNGEASRHYDESTAFAARLIKADPGNPAALFMLNEAKLTIHALSQQADPATARGLLEERRGLIEGLSNSPRAKLIMLADVDDGIGEAYFREGDEARALEHFAKALAVVERNGGVDGDDLAATYTAFLLHSRIGDINFNRGNVQIALDHYNRCLNSAVAALKRHSGDLRWQSLLAQAHEQVGDALAKQEPSRAREQYRLALDTMEKLSTREGSDRFPPGAPVRLEEARTYAYLAESLQALRDRDRSIRGFRAARRLLEPFAAANVDDVVAQRELLAILLALSDLTHDKDHAKAAIVVLQRLDARELLSDEERAVLKRLDDLVARPSWR